MRTRELRLQLLTDDGPALVYQRYFALHGCYPDWGVTPYQVIDAIVAREKQLGLDGQDRPDSSGWGSQHTDGARGMDTAKDGS